MNCFYSFSTLIVAAAARSLLIICWRLTSISAIVITPIITGPTYFIWQVSLYITHPIKEEAKSNAPPENPSGILAVASCVILYTSLAAMVKSPAMSVTK